jgi:hypothetical protein
MSIHGRACKLRCVNIFELSAFTWTEGLVGSLPEDAGGPDSRSPAYRQPCSQDRRISKPSPGPQAVEFSWPGSSRRFLFWSPDSPGDELAHDLKSLISLHDRYRTCKATGRSPMPRCGSFIENQRRIGRSAHRKQAAALRRRQKYSAGRVGERIRSAPLRPATMSHGWLLGGGGRVSVWTGCHASRDRRCCSCPGGRPCALLACPSGAGTAERTEAGAAGPAQ